MAGKLTKNRPQISFIHHHHNSQPIPDLISYQISPYHYYFGRIDRFQEGGTSRNHSRSMLPWSLTSRSSMSCVIIIGIGSWSPDASTWHGSSCNGSLLVFRFTGYRAASAINAELQSFG
ncbi:hypothetical protein HanIR_Chr16g0827321 [Helianthus annuus]|nr:hypothetical protein HanIR_Chr16g0827321 [Helianthus annuus]